VRGRRGGQGGPGATRFYLSLDDTLMRIFTPPSMRAMLTRLGMQPGEAIEHRWVTRAIETAQRKVEAHNFDIRKNLLEYDNVANDQRKAVYELRDELMGAEKVTALIDDIRPDVVNALVDTYIPPQTLESMWNVEGLEAALKKDFQLELPVQKMLDEEAGLDEKGLRARLVEAVRKVYEDKKARVGAGVLEHFEKAITLQVIDQFWREHLAAVDYLRQGIHLRGYAQKDPKQEYKREAFGMFNDMLGRFKHEVISILARVQIQTEAEVERIEAERRAAAEVAERRMQLQHAAAPDVLHGEAEPTAPQAAAPQRQAPVEREYPKVGRNDPCPCGSGKKYKHCHGQLV